MVRLACFLFVDCTDFFFLNDMLCTYPEFMIDGLYFFLVSDWLVVFFSLSLIGRLDISLSRM